MYGNKRLRLQRFLLQSSCIKDEIVKKPRYGIIIKDQCLDIIGSALHL